MQNMVLFILILLIRYNEAVATLGKMSNLMYHSNLRVKQSNGMFGWREMKGE
jgi:hypothetical protein